MPSTVAEQVGIKPSSQDGPNKLPANFDDVEKLQDDKLIFCYRPVSSEGEPQIGALIDDVFVATGHGPWGITLALGTGLVMAELVLGSKKLSADISQLSPHRFD
ncbi:hypothetical protein MVLG_03886 [Microbotryum lychnidis-dioicae p1A1 Lamole]|uniref:FAD dependent oxidoreductase domain-containing protein n=1 Tax=Microbotryum lychnidis-dioicae (strain p1A1 Lamole / MvSl-1064) TaxID=683840 RepID=U5H9J7_USTV1|nr:hypothetical protein MVLG_03886 [Microbotryum lychnidis-dioicae p1A1 Lamole]|eukprot:KDE05797.1 hypothetical protein MVLG_03886 [Microbotryum lychnidis-dioicae p1A1 Lamole]